jgi:GT2 family glycosyltransferase
MRTYDGARSDATQAAIPSEAARLRMSVIVPTFKRTKDLGRCLDALAKQSRPPDRIIIVVQDVDEETKRYLAERRSIALPEFEIVFVFVTGQVAALNAGLERVADGIVCFTDDDAAPRPDWLARIESHFASDPDVGGVGGRDHVEGESNAKEMKRVGLLEWYGRPVGNHHRGTGGVRRVDVLKGSNMSYRVAAVEHVRFDVRLRGEGAQRNNDLAFSLALRKLGWKIIYDPEVAVDHYPGNRENGIDRSELSARVISESAYNETLAVLDFLPRPLAPVFLLWAVLVGTRVLPGLVQAFRNTTRHPAIWQLFAQTVKARLDAAATLSRSRRTETKGRA